MALKLNKRSIAKLKEKTKREKYHKILVVDDELSNLDTIVRTLEEEYEVLTASDGQEALELLKSLEDPAEIHLILSDHRMPRITGIDFLALTIPIIPKTIRMILTGYTDIDAMIGAINEGRIYKFLTKPIEPKDLLVTVKRALEAFDLEQENDQLINQLKDLNANLEKKVENQTKLIQEKNREFLKDLEIAAEVQKTILPRLEPPPFLEIFNTVIPHSEVSGDITYSALQEDGKFLLFVGDATGHGASAALITLLVNWSLENAQDSLSIAQILDQLNTILFERTPTDKFMTGVFLRIAASGELQLKSAGHPPVLVFPNDGSEMICYTADTTPIGITPFLPRGMHGTIDHQLKKGDRVFVYTDGCFEVADAQRELFGLSRFKNFLSQCRNEPLAKVNDLVLNELKNFTDKEFDDDLTMVGFDYLGE